jgi:hypothetical protein
MKAQFRFNTIFGSMNRQIKEKTMKSKLFTLVVLAVLTMAGSILSQAQDSFDRHVLVINNTGYTVENLYASNVRNPFWPREDMFGWEEIPSGQSFVANIDDGSQYCLFDVKAVLSNGRELIHRNYNACDGLTLTLGGY